jgi:outer membrane protein assembly factor BamB
VRFRFRLTANASNSYDGWFIDKIRVMAGPAVYFLTEFYVTGAPVLTGGSVYEMSGKPVLTGSAQQANWPGNFRADSWKLELDQTFSGSLTTTGTVDVNGKTLTVQGDLTVSSGTLDMNGGTLIVTGNVNLTGGTLDVNGGSLKIAGNLTTTSSGRLKMIYDADVVEVTGNVTFSGYSTNGYLTAGILKVGGNFSQINGYGDAFAATGTHTVILNGSGLQTVNIQSPGVSQSRFQNLEIQNSLANIRFIPTIGLFAASISYPAGTDSTFGGETVAWDTPVDFGISDYQPAPVLGDIDGDGDLDLFVGQSNGNIRFYENLTGDPRQGKIGLGKEFSGHNFVRVPDAVDLRLGAAFTIEFWMLADSINETWKGLIGKSSSGYEGRNFALHLHYNKYLHFSYHNALGNEITLDTPQDSIIPGRWHHVALTFDKTQEAVKIYIDGTEKGSRSPSGVPVVGDASLWMGRNPEGSRSESFDGILDEVRISNSVRYNGPFTPPSAAFGPDANTIALWHMDELSSMNVSDSSGNGHDGFWTPWSLKADQIAGLAVDGYARPVFVDLDGDGDLDLFVGSNSGALFYFENAGNRYAPSWAAGRQLKDDTAEYIDPGTRTSPTLVDIDHDGKHELLIGYRDRTTSKAAVAYYENMGTATQPNWKFITGNYIGNELGSSIVDPRFTDLERDNDYDLLTGLSNGTLALFRNIGTEGALAWALPEFSYAGFNAGSESVPAFADLDGDGRQDLIVGGSSGIYFLRNKGTARIAANGGQAVTNSRNVALSLNASGMEVNGYYLSSDPTPPAAGAPGWIAVESTTTFTKDSIPYTLETGDGIKRIYVWFKNSAGRLWNESYTEIILKTYTSCSTPDCAVAAEINQPVRDALQETAAVKFYAFSPGNWKKMMLRFTPDLPGVNYHITLYLFDQILDQYLRGDAYQGGAFNKLITFQEIPPKCVVKVEWIGSGAPQAGYRFSLDGAATATAGGKIWEFLTTGIVQSPPSVFGNLVYTGSDDGSVYATDLATGSKVWSYKTGGAIQSSPVVHGGQVYVGSTDGKVYCLDSQTGVPLWESQTGGAIYSSPAVISGKVYVGSADSKVYCLDTQTGVRLWEYSTGGAVYSSPAIQAGKVCVGSTDGKMLCLDAQTGAKLWEYQTESAIYYSSPTIAEDKVYVGSYDSKLYCLDAQTGAKLWEYQTGSNIYYPSPTVASGKVYVGSYDNKVYCLDAQSGVKLWEYQTGGAIYSSPAVVAGKVYVGSNDNKVYCLDAQSGLKLWEYQTGGAIYSSPAVVAGKVYVGSNDQNLYCLDAGDPDATGWPMSRHDLQHTGNGDYKNPTLRYTLIQAKSLDAFKKYELHLVEVREDQDVFVHGSIPFSLSDPAVATINGNILTALKNGRVVVRADNNGVHFERTFFLMVSPDDYEGFDNDTREKADLLPAGQFWQGDLLPGSTSMDTDYYKITIPTASVIEAAYLVERDTQDAKIELLQPITAAMSIFHDEFNGSLLQVWRIINPDPTKYSLTENPGSLRLYSTNADLYYNNLTNLFSVPLPVGPTAFTLTAKLSFPTAPSQNYQQGGIVLYGDSGGNPDQDNYIRVMYAYENGLRAEAAYEINGAYTAESGIDLNIGQNALWLRLAKTGDSYTGSYSLDGQTFTPFFGPITQSWNIGHAGIFAANGRWSNAPSLPMDFDDVEVTATAGELSLGSVISKNGRNRLLSAGVPPGDYYLKITPAGDVDQGSSYYITYRIVSSLPARLPVPIGIGETKSGEVYSRTDSGEFTFTLAAAKNLDIFLVPGGIEADYLVEVLDQEGRTIKRVTTGNGLAGGISVGLRAGSYAIKITSSQDIDATHPFSLSLQESADPYEVEPNDTYQGATRIEKSIGMQGFLDDTVDFYTFSLDAPTYVRLNFEAITAGTEYRLTLYKNDDQNPIDTSACSKGASTFFEVGLSSGDYYVKVEGVGLKESYPRYLLTLADSANTQLEIESNNTLPFANALDSVHPKMGRITSAADVDYYGFYVPAETMVTINLSTDSTTADYKISFVNGAGGVIKTNMCTDGAATALGQKLPAGNYYVKIEANGDVDQAKFYTISTITASLVGLKSLVGIVLSAPTNHIGAGGTLQVAAQGNYSDATQSELSGMAWSSSDDRIAAVNSSGLVTGVAAGNATIYASLSGQLCQINLSVGGAAVQDRQTRGNLILVAGGGVAATNTLKESTQYMADLVYSRFLARGFKKEDIYYMNPIGWKDIDGDGYNDHVVNEEAPTVAKLRGAMETWAVNQPSTGPLYVVLIDHGGIDTFEVFPGEVITAAQLDSSFAAFETTTGRETIVIIEACKSGSFINDLATAGSKRMVITSTDEGNTFAEIGGRISFTQFLMDQLYGGNTFRQSYQNTVQKLANIGTPYSMMAPQLKEGQPNTLALTRLGGNFAIAGLFPVISDQTPDISITANTGQTFNASVDDLTGKTRVWAVVTPPDYVAPEVVGDLEAPQVTLPIFDLTDEVTGIIDGIYTGTYDDFRYNGVYRVVFYARNADGLVVDSPPTLVTVTGGLNAASKLTVTKSGTGGGTVTSDPAGIACGADCSESYAENTQVTLTATPDTNSDFTGWSGACTGSGGCTVTMTDAKGVTASFAKKSYTMMVNPITNGSVVCTPNPAEYGSTVTCSISPTLGYRIDTVTVDGSPVTLTAGMYTFTNITGSHTIGVVFTQILKGDLNDDRSVNLVDAILALKVIEGQIPATIRTDYPTSGADVNGDGKIGLPEVIYILQKTAGVR